MTYITYHIASTQIVKYFDEKADAKRSATWANKKKPGTIAYAELEDYRANVVTKKTVINLMSGKEVVIDSNTPRCCDVSSELYWSC